MRPNLRSKAQAGAAMVTMLAHMIITKGLAGRLRHGWPMKVLCDMCDRGCCSDHPNSTVHAGSHPPVLCWGLGLSFAKPPSEPGSVFKCLLSAAHVLRLLPEGLHRTNAGEGLEEVSFQNRLSLAQSSHAVGTRVCSYCRAGLAKRQFVHALRGRGLQQCFVG